MTNRDFLVILFSLGNMNGIWNSLGILVNSIYLEYFPVSGVWWKIRFRTLN